MKSKFTILAQITDGDYFKVDEEIFVNDETYKVTEVEDSEFREEYAMLTTFEKVQ